MQNTAKQQETGQNAWYSRNREQSLADRTKAVQNLNDPGTNADEMLRFTKIFLYLLLAFTALLGGMSYYKNFQGAFPVYVAVFLAVAITLVIEFGKNYCATWVLRMPFFWGLMSTVRSLPRFLMWVGLICVAVATFYMSIRNSTIGAQQLSLLLAHQGKEAQATFSAHTPELDGQIDAAQAAQAASLSNRVTTGKYKGMVEWHSNAAAKKAGASADALIATKEKVVAQQRADWETKQERLEGNRNYAANLLLLAGGWVELLQILLIVIRVACEKSLDLRQGNGNGPSPTPPGQTRSQNGQSFPSNQGHQVQNATQGGNISARHYVPLPPVLPAVGGPNLPDGAELQPDGSVLFKQSNELFKQLRNGIGTVIGLEYKGPRMAMPTVLAYSDVRGRISSYKKNHGRRAATRVQMVAMWEFALSLFEVPEDAVETGFQPIFHEEGGQA